MSEATLETRDSAAANLADRVQTDIFYGRLAPGMWLKQTELERHYACSRLALRQALDAVAAKGMLRHEANRGYHVDQFDASAVTHIAEARAVLEIASAELVLPYVTTDYLGQLEKLAKRHKKALSSGTELEHEEANRQFHAAMHAPCPNRIIVDLTSDLRRRVPLAITRRTNTPVHLRARMLEHFEMIEAFRRRDARALREILWRHIVPPQSDGPPTGRGKQTS